MVSAELRVVDPADPVVQQCWLAYFATIAERFDAGYDPERSRHVGLDEVRPPRGATVVVFLDDQPVACGSVKHHGDWAEVKRVWVSPDARGLGLARRIMADLEARAHAQGAAVIRLDTNRTLTEAIALYGKLGYREVQPYNDEPYAHHWFEKALVSSG
ncbi:MAG TPA: GNAT family N-acetyltransferase [Nocardioidaceae bacterium]|nr:GNAT family N-acetyltransferase [Nocardioidaceae bacterium]